MPSCVGTIKLTLISEHMDFGIFCSYSHLVQSSNVKITYLDTYTSLHRLVFEHYFKNSFFHKHELSTYDNLVFYLSVGKKIVKECLIEKVQPFVPKA